MEKRIYKYELETQDSQYLELPMGYEILTVQTQNEVPCLWALVDPNEERREGLCIEIFGTGQDVFYDMGVDREYISTYQLQGGAFIGHVFKRNN